MTHQRRIVSLETEYGLMYLPNASEAGFDNDDDWNTIIGNLICGKGVGKQRRSWQLYGGCLYLDHGSHPEHAGPECLSGYEVALFDRVGERLLVENIAASCDMVGFSGTVLLAKNNVSDNGHSWGSHENYSIPIEIHNPYHLQPLVDFLATRIIWSGSGRITVDQDELQIHLSQRAPFIHDIYSLATMEEEADYAPGNNVDEGRAYKRALICLRPEHDESEDGWTRLHLINGDSNIIDWVTINKVDITALLLEQIAAGELQPFGLTNVIEDFHALNRDPGSWLDSAHGYVTALEVQRYYYTQACLYVGRHKLHKSWGLVLRNWNELLHRFEAGKLIWYCDWATKQGLLEEKRRSFCGSEREWLQYGRRLDRAYHSVNGPGIVNSIRRRAHGGIPESLIANGRTQPPRTRAAVRGELVRRAELNNWAYDPDWSDARVGGLYFPMTDPYETSFEDLDSLEALIDRIQ